MTSSRAGIALLLGTLGSCWLIGCAASTGRARGDAVPGQEKSKSAQVGEEQPAGGASAAGTRGETPLPTFCDGKPIELVEDKYADGTTKLLEEVVIGDDGEQILHGLSTVYWPNGSKKLELEYHCGVRHGIRIAWYQNGQMWSQGAFVNGRDDGTWTVWFPDGSKSQEFTMDHGAWNGRHTVWGPDGRKLLEEEWVHGKRQGTVRIWDQEGNLVREDQYHDNAKQPMPTSKS